MSASAAQPDRYIKLPEVIDLSGLGKTMIYRLIRNGDFPAPIKVTDHASRWSQAEVLHWRDQRAQKRAA